MFRIGVILIACAVLFSLTALALAAGDRLRHPIRAAVAIAAALAVGIVALLE